MNPTLNKGLVLVVDDSQVNLQLADAILQENQYKTHLISESHRTLPWVMENQPDLILMDIMMPGLDGLTLCRMLKDTPRTASIPVLFLSAKSRNEEVVEGLKCGGGDFITKPFQSEELIARVDIHLKFYQQQRQLEQKNKELEETLSRLTKVSDAMLKICAWTKRIKVNDQWVSVDEYLGKHLGLKLTHGISDEAMEVFTKETYDTAEKKLPSL